LELFFRRLCEEVEERDVEFGLVSSIWIQNISPSSPSAGSSKTIESHAVIHITHVIYQARYVPEVGAVHDSQLPAALLLRPSFPRKLRLIAMD
jgi:hypothetical protein